MIRVFVKADVKRDHSIASTFTMADSRFFLFGEIFTWLANTLFDIIAIFAYDSST